MSLDKLKLSKRLTASMRNLGYLTAKEFQLRALTRISGGHQILGIAPDGAGKTSTYILGSLMRLKYSEDEAPKILVLAPNQEKVDAIVEEYYSLSANKELHIMGLKSSGSMEEEIEDLVRGVDIVVATPNRARAVYLKLGLNLNRIQTFIIDDAEEIIKQGMQNTVKELARSCGDVQYIAMSTVEHGKLHYMIDDFMPLATLIEVDEIAEVQTLTHELLLYNVPNFTTKISLLNLFIDDSEVFSKAVVFVNSKLTAHNLLNRLHAKKGEAAIYNAFFVEDLSIDNINDFRLTSECRILLIANEDLEEINLENIPFIFHFEIPDNIDMFIKHVRKTNDQETIAITFATDIELAEVRKIENLLGKKMSLEPLPEELLIYSPTVTETKEKESTDKTRGGAFHKKKESNSKTYNYGGGQKAKMTKKNKKR